MRLGLVVIIVITVQIAYVACMWIMSREIERLTVVELWSQ